MSKGRRRALVAILISMVQRAARELPSVPRAALLEDALNQALGSLPARLRDQYIEALRAIPKFKWNIATKTTKRVSVLGKMKSGAQVINGVAQAPELLQLDLHLSRFNAAYKNYRDAYQTAFKGFRDAGLSESEFRIALGEWKAANPAPEFFRLANVDEVAETLVHELAHAIDVQAGTSEANWHGITRLWQADDMQAVCWKDGYWRGNATVEKIAGRNVVKPIPDAAGRIKGDHRFAYGTSVPTEGFAEAMRLYFVGDTGGASGAGSAMTAAEFRSAYPRIAEWIERNVIGGG